MCGQATGVSRIIGAELVTSVVCPCKGEREFSREPYDPELIPGIVTQAEAMSRASDER